MLEIKKIEMKYVFRKYLIEIHTASFQSCNALTRITKYGTCEWSVTSSASKSSFTECSWSAGNALSSRNEGISSVWLSMTRTICKIRLQLLVTKTNYTLVCSWNCSVKSARNPAERTTMRDGPEGSDQRSVETCSNNAFLKLCAITSVNVLK